MQRSSATVISRLRNDRRTSKNSQPKHAVELLTSTLACDDSNNAAQFNYIFETHSILSFPLLHFSSTLLLDHAAQPNATVFLWENNKTDKTQKRITTRKELLNNTIIH
jgi:hypothetical protein